MTKVEAGGINVFYEMQGEGEPLLFIHGLVGTGISFPEPLPIRGGVPFAASWRGLIYRFERAGEEAGNAGNFL